MRIIGDATDCAIRTAESWTAQALAAGTQWGAPTVQPTRFHRPNTVTATWPIALLRDFSPAVGASTAETRPTPAPTPTLVIPPRSGNASCIVDLSESTSLLGAALAAGLTNLHCIDWLTPSGPRADTGIEAHLQVLREAVSKLGGRVNLIGFSQGGWLAAMFAARWPESALTLTVAGTPIDSHHGLGRSLLPGALLRRAGQHAGELAWRLPGADNSDAAYRNWLFQPQPVPTALALWMLDHLVIRNGLVRGTLRIAGSPVDLAAISCPLFLVAGLRDPLATPGQLWRLGELASTPERLIVKVGINCGHLEMIADESTLRRHWIPLLRDVRVASAARA